MTVEQVAALRCIRPRPLTRNTFAPEVTIGRTARASNALCRAWLARRPEQTRVGTSRRSSNTTKLETGPPDSRANALRRNGSRL